MLLMAIPVVLCLRNSGSQTPDCWLKLDRNTHYSAIAPLITGLSDDYESLTAFFNNASVKGVIHPDGTIKHYAPGTIEKWYRNYKEGGFDGNRFISGHKKAQLSL